MRKIRKMVVFANLKIFMESRFEVKEYVQKMKNNVKSIDTNLVEIHIMTDFLSFDYVKKNLASTGIKVGVQDIFWEDSGAFTGEVAPLMLKDLGCDSAFIGHSVRKTLFHETDESINKKVLACLRNNIVPLMFIGETREEMEEGLTEEVLKRQLRAGLSGVEDSLLPEVIIVFEPRWAIGQKEPASLDMIKKMHMKTRAMLSELYSKDAADLVRIIYGGGVNLGNIGEIIKIREVDGAGAARASVSAKDFTDLIKAIESEARKRSDDA